MAPNHSKPFIKEFRAGQIFTYMPKCPYLAAIIKPSGWHGRPNGAEEGRSQEQTDFRSRRSMQTWRPISEADQLQLTLSTHWVRASHALHLSFEIAQHHQGALYFVSSGCAGCRGLQLGFHGCGPLSAVAGQTVSFRFSARATPAIPSSLSSKRACQTAKASRLRTGRWDWLGHQPGLASALATFCRGVQHQALSLPEPRGAL